MRRRIIVAGALLGAAALVAGRLARRPPAWVGLHLADGMLLALGPDEPEVPGLRADAGEVIRALQPGMHHGRSSMTSHTDRS
ncbi:MAG: hypothetical protein FJ000_00830 [Actinobacteria bacterium]|nr:hypothetical protein [Actinomycetota bacterium]